MAVISRSTLVVGLAPCSALCQRPQRPPKRQPLVLTRAEPEGSNEPAPPAAEQKPKTSYYIDELPEVKRTELSPEMKARLKQEYYGLGGSPNKAMGNNWFLIISLFIAGLAVLSALTGAL